MSWTNGPSVATSKRFAMRPSVLSPLSCDNKYTASTIRMDKSQLSWTEGPSAAKGSHEMSCCTFKRETTPLIMQTRWRVTLRDLHCWLVLVLLLQLSVRMSEHTAWQYCVASRRRSIPSYSVWSSPEAVQLDLTCNLFTQMTCPNVLMGNFFTQVTCLLMHKAFSTDLDSRIVRGCDANTFRFSGCACSTKTHTLGRAWLGVTVTQGMLLKRLSFLLILWSWYFGKVSKEGMRQCDIRKEKRNVLEPKTSTDASVSRCELGCRCLKLPVDIQRTQISWQSGRIIAADFCCNLKALAWPNVYTADPDNVCHIVIKRNSEMKSLQSNKKINK